MNRRMMSIAPWALALALALLSDAAAQTVCNTTPAPRSVQTRPALTGRMVFQSPTQLYLTDFSAGTTNPISFTTSSGPAPTLTAASNAIFSADGRWIVFYAGWTPTGGQQRFDVFVARSDGSHLVDLTVDQDPSQNYEDPAFTANQTTVYFKRLYLPQGSQTHAAAIMKMQVSLPPVGSSSDPSRVGAPVQVLNDNVTEYSKPSPSPTGKYVYYFTGTSPNLGVYRLNTQSGAVETVSAVSGVVSYYPVPRDLTATFYAGWINGSTNDQIWVYAPGVKSANTLLSLNDPNYNDSDPASVDEDYILFSSNRCSVAGVSDYKLYVGQPGTTKYWLLNIDGIWDPAGGLLGSNYTLTPAGP